MKQEFSEKDVLNLLSGLKSTESGYPADMIKLRRETFMSQAAALAVLAGSGGNGSTASGSGQATPSGTTFGGMTLTRLLETALVIVLVLEAGIATYIYRDRIAEFINSTLRPQIEQTANPQDAPSLDLLSGGDPSTMTPAVTVTTTDTETPVPLNSSSPASSNNNNNSDAGDIQITSTPNPNGNPGLHLGQTKQPTQDSEDTQNNTNNKNPNDKGKNE